MDVKVTRTKAIAIVAMTAIVVLFALSLALPPSYLQNAPSGSASGSGESKPCGDKTYNPEKQTCCTNNGKGIVESNKYSCCGEPDKQVAYKKDSKLCCVFDGTGEVNNILRKWPQGCSIEECLGKIPKVTKDGCEKLKMDVETGWIRKTFQCTFKCVPKK